MNRRGFLLNGLALGCSAAASPLMTPMAFASAPWDKRLVVLILRGAMDGLDVVQPYGDPAYAALRPNLFTGPQIDLDGFYAMHPALSPLLPLWQAGELGFAHAMSTPYRDKRSHFDGQDLLEAGGASVDDGIDGGWLNRMVATVPGVRADMSYAIGRDDLLILHGDAPVSRWAPETELSISPQMQRLLQLVHEGDPLFEQASADAIQIAQEVALGGDMQMARGSSSAVRQAQFAAQRLSQEARIASFSLTGWDTHSRQDQSLGRALRNLSDVILALKDGLGPVWRDTAVLAVTEFGRTARENGLRGTDHGTAGAMVTAGGALRGGRVLADWPGLGEGDLYDGRDLMPTRDVRALTGWVMHSLFGIEKSVITQAIFPGVDLGPDPRFTA